MASVPVLKPHEVVRAFQKLGWEVARQRGSHIILTKPGQICNFICTEPGCRGSLRSLIARADITVGESMFALDR